MDMSVLVEVLREMRVPVLREERLLTVAVAETLTHAGIGFEREVVLKSADMPPQEKGARVDFLCEDIVLELKLNAKKAVIAQAARYLAFPQVAGLVLVANRTVDLSRLARITGKPCVCVCPLRSWGVAL